MFLSNFSQSLPAVDGKMCQSWYFFTNVVKYELVPSAFSLEVRSNYYL